jgi:hypothetical protein
MPFIWIVLAMLVFFGAYSLAPVFGLDEVWPGLFASDSILGWGILFVLMLLGGLYWRGFWIKSQKRQERRDD